IAQTTGGISGVVSDQSGGLLPGVTVEISGPNLQGTRTATSGSDGRYRFLNIPPGTYTVVARLTGFSRVGKTAVRVEVGKEFTVNMTLTLSAKEEVVVSGEAPVVDTTSTTIGQVVNSEQFRRLPLQRDYANIAQTAPGVNTDAVGNTVYGSSGSENAYIIDGGNTTEGTTGVQGKSLNTEFIQELEVKNGGYQAEFGRATGGVINVITKSGGNEFHGEAFGYYDNDSLQSTNKHIDEIKVRNSTGPSLQTGFTRKDFGADLGGYF